MLDYQKDAQKHGHTDQKLAGSEMSQEMKNIE